MRISTLMSAFLIAAVSSVAMAQTTTGGGSTGGATTGGGTGGGTGHPCKQIEAACQAAGYVKGGHKKTPPMGLWLDCVKPIIAGTQVPNVTIDPAVLSACQAKKASFKHQD